jgi:hypothetical protein
MLDKAGKAFLKTQSPRVPNTPLRFEDNTIPESQKFWIQLGLTSTLLERILETNLVRINLRAPNMPLRFDDNKLLKSQTFWIQLGLTSTLLERILETTLVRINLRQPNKPLRLVGNTKS